MSAHATPVVIGLDLSLTSTGVACSGGADRIRTTADRPIEERLKYIVEDVLEFCDDADLVVIEDLLTHGKASHPGLGLVHGAVRLALHYQQTPMLLVPPSTLKKYATGKGNASKELVLAEAIRRLGYAGSSNDEADALWLYEIGLALLEDDRAVPVPAAHRAALDALQQRTAA